MSHVKDLARFYPEVNGKPLKSFHWDGEGGCWQHNHIWLQCTREERELALDMETVIISWWEKLKGRKGVLREVHS